MVAYGRRRLLPFSAKTLEFRRQANPRRTGPAWPENRPSRAGPISNILHGYRHLGESEKEVACAF
jgi:hypothetical protein